MSDKKGKVVGMGNPTQGQPRLNVDPSKLKTVECDNCGGIFFTEVTMFKDVPATQSPTGQKSMLPIPVLKCSDCGNVPERFLPKELR